MAVQTAKQQAIKDIKKELKTQSRVFISYISALDPIMESIVEDYLQQQKQIKNEL